MINIRQNIWESNSSSSHSININSDTSLLTSITPDSEGNIILNGGEFGWGWKKYNDALTKSNYAAVAVHLNYSFFNNPSLKTMLVDVIKNQTGAKNVIFNINTDYNDKSGLFSYIDHQSLDSYVNSKIAKIFKSKENLRNFIFNPKSILYIGNDNSDCPPNFYDDENKVFDYEIILERTKDSFKVTKSELENKEFLEEVLKNLFSRNDLNEYNSDRDYWDSECSKLFSWPSFYGSRDDEKFNVVDFKNQTITVVNKESIYKIDPNDNSKQVFAGYKIKEKRLIKYHIKKIL
jgi:hypothetical protein